MFISDGALSLTTWGQIDAVCDAFENDWRQQRRPRIEDCLACADEAARPALAGELVRLELEWRLLRGERPLVTEYAERFPALTEVLPSWLAAALEATAQRQQVTTCDVEQTPSAPANAPAELSVAGVVRRLGEYELLEAL